VHRGERPRSLQRLPGPRSIHQRKTSPNSWKGIPDYENGRGARRDYAGRKRALPSEGHATTRRDGTRESLRSSTTGCLEHSHVRASRGSSVDLTALCRSGRIRNLLASTPAHAPPEGARLFNAVPLRREPPTALLQVTHVLFHSSAVIVWTGMSFADERRLGDDDRPNRRRLGRRD
jgi:hypothetical protein